MKRLIFILPALLLTGCLVTAPVKQKFPEVPAELLKACPDLKQVEQTEKLSEVLKVVSKNYSQYHECQITVDTWIEWYNLQKQIYNK
jgi:hypothetical protein